MPIPFLPFDVIATIISHEEEEDIPLQEQISIGKSASLVCSTWRPLGQALRWRTVGILPERISSLANHFAQHPHLVKFVRVCSIQEDSFEFSGAFPRRQLTHLLRSCLNLQAVILVGKFGEAMTAIIGVLSRAQALRKLILNVTENVEWTNDLSSTFSDGFRRLSIFALASGRLSFPAQLNSRPRKLEDGIPLKELMLSWQGEPSEGRQFAAEFFSTLNLGTLQNVTLFHSITYRNTIEQLLLFSNLRQLELNCSRNTATHTFSSLLTFLPHFPSLQYLRFHCTEKAGPLRIQSPVTLHAVLTSFPPSLRQFRARQFIFPDLNTLPTHSTIDTQGNHQRKLRSLYALDAEQSEPKKLIVWEEEEEGGCTRWYRRLESEQKDGSIRRN